MTIKLKLHGLKTQFVYIGNSKCEFVDGADEGNPNIYRFQWDDHSHDGFEVSKSKIMNGSTIPGAGNENIQYHITMLEY